MLPLYAHKLAVVVVAHGGKYRGVASKVYTGQRGSVLDERSDYIRIDVDPMVSSLIELSRSYCLVRLSTSCIYCKGTQLIVLVAGCFWPLFHASIRPKPEHIAVRAGEP